MTASGAPAPTPDRVAAKRIAGVLAQADAELSATLGWLQQLRQELRNLIIARLERPWSAEEFFRYLALSADERRAHRRYLATRKWQEAALRRLRQMSSTAEPFTSSSESGDPA